jgi:hypothetical protein
VLFYRVLVPGVGWFGGFAIIRIVEFIRFFGDWCYGW